jgi:hypothetical protein
VGQRIKLPKRDPGIRVELGPESQLVEFALKPMTLEIEEQLHDIRRENLTVEENPDSRPLDFAEAELRQLDVVLEVTNANRNQDAPTTVPSEVMLGDPDGDPPRPGYLTGDITRGQIQETLARIMGALRP